jgi:hypothetical protein
VTVVMTKMTQVIDTITHFTTVVIHSRIRSNVLDMPSTHSWGV